MRHLKFTTVTLVNVLCLSAASAAQPVVRDQIIVTATKRTESIQDVPISIAAYSGETLEKAGVDTLFDLSQMAPNLYISNASQIVNQVIAIRGVGSESNSAIDPSVAVYVDGAYVARSGSLLGNLKDIEAVEVLRGPQGTLFGRNASMGAINIRTKRPDLSGHSLSIDAGAGNYGAYDVSAIGNAALTETLAARLAVNYSSFDGFGENAYDGNKNVGGRDSVSLRGSVLYQPADNFDIVLRGDYQELEDGGLVIEVLPKSATQARLDNLAAVTGGVLPDYSGLDQKINQVHEDNVDDTQWGGVIDMTWDEAVAGHSFRSITSYRDWDNTSREFSVLRLPLEDAGRLASWQSESWSQELQMLSPTGGVFDYVGGLYIFKEDYQIEQSFFLGPDFCPVILGNSRFSGFAAACAAGAQDNATPSLFEQSARSLAAYLQGTIHLSDVFDVTGGIRYSDDKKEGSLVVDSNNVVASTLFAAVEQHDLNFSDGQATWLVTAKYFIKPDFMSYATVSTGYKSGGFNSIPTNGGLSTDDRIFQSEDVMNYELGFKSTWLDGRLVANATLYRTEIEGFQDRSFQNLSFSIRNAGKLRQQGVELDLQYSPIDQLFLTLGYAFLDSEFLEFDNAPSLPGVGGTQDLAGTSNRNSPRNQLNLAAEWSDNLGDTGLDWFFRGEFNYTGATNVGGTSNNNPQTIQDSYGLGNLRAGLTGNDGAWSVAAFVQNIGDVQYCPRMFDQPAAGLFGLNIDGGTLIRCNMGAPRTLGVRASIAIR